MSRKLANQMVDSDEFLARALQAEEQEAAAKFAAAVAEDERWLGPCRTLIPRLYHVPMPHPLVLAMFRQALPIPLPLSHVQRLQGIIRLTF